MREKMIQCYRLNAVGAKPADFVIAPDVTSFDISEWTRADEMATIGEAAARETIPKLRKMLNKLDPELFAADESGMGPCLSPKLSRSAGTTSPQLSCPAVASGSSVQSPWALGKEVCRGASSRSASGGTLR